MHTGCHDAMMIMILMKIIFIYNVIIQIKYIYNCTYIYINVPWSI